MRWKGYLAGAFALALAACGGGSRPAMQAQTPGGPQVGTTQSAAVGAEACADGVTVRLVGVNPGDVSSLILQLAFLTERFPGTDAPESARNIATWPIDVSTDAMTHDLGTIRIPTNLFGPKVSAFFSSGTATLGGVSGALDTCTNPIEFPLDTPRLEQMTGCLIVIALDVGRSVVATPAGLSFLPQFRVLFQETP